MAPVGEQMKILVLDFDGVLHSYTSGWMGASIIPDPPVEGAIAFLREAVKHFAVNVFSSRSNDQFGREAMRVWIAYWATKQRLSNDEDTSWHLKIAYPPFKPPAFVTLDDRTITFSGVFPPIEALKGFKPWNQK
jgi:hypothetical protein